MAKILIIGDPTTALGQVRGPIGVRAGHDVFWFSARHASLPGVQHFSIPHFAQHSQFLRAILRPIFLRKTIQVISPDIVHVHYAQTGLMTFQLIKQHPLIVTVMGGDIMLDQGYRGVSTFFIRKLLDNADYITSKSNFMDQALNKIGDYQNKIKRITWGVDLEQFCSERDVLPLRAKLAIPDNDLVVFDPRLAIPFYNKHIILQAFANFLQRTNLSITLIVSEAKADPEYVRKLKKSASDLGVFEKVRFVGKIPYEQMPDYYALADITVSVPPSDGLPQTIYEAFACGSFLILGNLPQYREIIQDKITGYLVPVGSTDALCDALLWASTNVDVRNKAKQIGREYVEKNANFNTQVDLVNKLYDELLYEGRKYKAI